MGSISLSPFHPGIVFILFSYLLIYQFHPPAPAPHDWRIPCFSLSPFNDLIPGLLSVLSHLPTAPTVIEDEMPNIQKRAFKFLHRFQFNSIHNHGKPEV